MNLFSVEKPRIHILSGGTADVDQYVAKTRFETEQRIAVRILRGARMKNWEGFYDEFASALQFPLYFGRNWDALDECLADLEWLQSNAYLLVFADAALILKATEEGDTEAFFKLLSRIGNEWAEDLSLGLGIERKSAPFHVVLHTVISEADDFLHRVEMATGDPVTKIAVL